jgi:hypothetical protein
MNEQMATGYFTSKGGTLESFETKRDRWNFGAEAIVNFSGDLQIWIYKNGNWEKE